MIHAYDYYDSPLTFTLLRFSSLKQYTGKLMPKFSLLDIAVRRSHVHGRTKDKHLLFRQLVGVFLTNYFSSDHIHKYLKKYPAVLPPSL